MKAVLLSKKEVNNVEVPVNYTDMPLEYLKAEFPEVYESIMRSRRVVDGYIYMRNM